MAAAPAAADNGVLKTLDFDGGTPVQVPYSDLRVAIDKVTGPYGDPDFRARGFRQGRRVFVMQLGAGRALSRASLAFLKSGRKEPAVVLQVSKGGCCSSSWVAIPTPGQKWAVRKGDLLDGAYKFQDLDGDGIPELIGTDATFRLLDLTPKMDTGRFAPIAVRKIKGDELVRVGADPNYRRVVIDSLAALESQAKSQADWHDNSFLAAWVATKVMLGDGQAAWARMLKSYTSHKSLMCELPMRFAPCRKEHETLGDVPALLRRHLFLEGYIPDEKAYPLPAGPTGPTAQ